MYISWLSHAARMPLSQQQAARGGVVGVAVPTPAHAPRRCDSGDASPGQRWRWAASASSPRGRRLAPTPSTKAMATLRQCWRLAPAPGALAAALALQTP